MVKSVPCLSLDAGFRLASLCSALLLASVGCSQDPTGGGPLTNGGTGGDGGTSGAGGSAGKIGTGGAGGGTGGSTGGSGGAGGVATGGTGGSIDVGEHLRFWGAGHGFASPVWSVSSDQAGNVWAANAKALLLLRPGSEEWKAFTEADGLSPYPPISVGGGRANEVFVGYRGLFPDSDPFDDPPEVASSGGVDRIRIDGGDTLTKFRFDISSPPAPEYPTGRHILRICYREVPVLTGPYAGDVWFGCNHGVAMWNERFQMVQEHQHSAISLNDSLYVGDFRGVAIAPDGNVWLGGDVRSALLRYADEGGQFWATMDEMDVWPPGVALDPGDPMANDWVMDMAVDSGGGLWVASFGNGLAHRAPNGSWSYIDTRQGLPDNRVYGLAFDPDGSLWIATDAGLARLGGGGIRQVLTAMDGLPGTILGVAVDTTSTPRRVIVGTSAGIGIYDGP